MPLVATESTLKDAIPQATQRALQESGLAVDSAFDLTMRIIHSDPRIIHATRGDSEEHIGFLIVGQESLQATRTSFLNVNWFSLAAAVVALTRAPTDPASYVAFLAAFAVALTSKLSQEQAAFFVATELLSRDGRLLTLDNLSKKIGALTHQPSYSDADTIRLIASIKSQGIRVVVGPGRDNIVSYEERAMFLPV